MRQTETSVHRQRTPTSRSPSDENMNVSSHSNISTEHHASVASFHHPLRLIHVAATRCPYAEEYVCKQQAAQQGVKRGQQVQGKGSPRA